MKRLSSIIIAFAILTRIAAANEKPATLYQFSTLPALGIGLFQGSEPYGEIERHGDFGLGTFNALDGEMVALDGHYYQVRSDGRVFAADRKALAPFAEVTFFKPGQTIHVDKEISLADLQRIINAQLPTQNICYAIKVHGEFRALKTRSVPAQTKPYPTLGTAVKGQSVFNKSNEQGTMVGFWYPSFMSGANVSGFHFHFIADDHKSGGHLLDCTTSHVTVEIQVLRSVQIVFPHQSEFEQANLGAQTGSALDAAEKGK